MKGAGRELDVVLCSAYLRLCANDQGIQLLIIPLNMQVSQLDYLSAVKINSLLSGVAGSSV